MPSSKRAPKPSAAGFPQAGLFFIGFTLAAFGQIFLAQPEKPYTLWVGLLFYVAAFWKWSGQPSVSKKEKPSLPLKFEIWLFALILVLGFFLRIYRIDSLPAGMHTDQGLIGQCALRILNEGWRPFGEVFNYEVPEILLFYQMAGWFGLVGSSYLTFHLFFILLSLAAFPFVYWTIRQWADQRTALLSLFILSVMRWNWIETRNGYPSIQVPFYLFGALALWLYWRKSQKKWPFYLSALFVGVGFYTYQAFKIVPLLMGVLAYYEWATRREKKKASLRPYFFYSLIVLIIATPLLKVMWDKGQIGYREKILFIGTQMVEEKSLKPLWDVAAGTALMFNRKGDMNSRHNIPGHRMLDDITAVLFLLGVALVWRKRKEPGGFYPLVGFGIMGLTGLLSTDIAHSNRLVCLTPFVAFFAGVGGITLLDNTAVILRGKRAGVFGGVILALAAITAQNAYTYFVEQAGDARCQEGFGLEQNFIGRNIEQAWKSFPNQNRFFISPFYFKNHTVAFLTYPARENVLEFNLQDWAAGKIPADKPAFVFLEGEKSGVLDFLNARYHDVKVLPYADSRGQKRVLLCYIPREDLKIVRPWDRGLRGVYRNSNLWDGGFPLVRRDPLLNLISKWDFPFTDFPPFRVRWTGSLEIPKAGSYQFQVLTTDQAQLWLDGKVVALEKPLALAAKSHTLRLDFEKDQGDAIALHFIWKKPGDEKWSIVPATAFGRINR